MSDESGTPATGNETPVALQVGETVTPADAPRPTETVEFWKQKSREQEARAKANADAARRLQEIEESQKTEAQRQADAVARATREAAEARAEAARFKAAATHGIKPDYLDLLGSGDEETVSARAQRLAPLLAAAAEADALRAELEALRQGKPGPLASRPVADLKPGATPSDAPADEAEFAAYATAMKLPSIRK